MDILKTLRTLPIFKIIPVDSDLTEIAITDNPAIEEFFLKFNSEEIKMSFNSDRMIITGPVMIPNQLIYRNDSLGERFVTYDSDGVKIAAELFMKNGLKFNAEHTDKILPINILESYFATENNEFNVPVGSWIVSAKVNDLQLWDKLKMNNFGFSFQSYFSNKMIGSEQINFNKDERMNLKEKVMEAVNAVLFSEEKIVDEVKDEAPVVETVVELAAVEVEVEATPEESPVDVETEIDPIILSAIEQAVSTLKEEILAEVSSMVSEIVTQGKATEQSLVEMSAKLVEFSKQPLSKAISETVTNPVKLDNQYSYLKDINK